MNDQQFQSAFDQGDQMLVLAQNEICRPREDVVPQLACSKARKSIEQYLTSFLIKNGVETPGTLNLDELLSNCRSLSPKFNEIRFEHLYCSATQYDSSYCVDLEKVTECVHLAERTRFLVFEESRPLLS